MRKLSSAIASSAGSLPLDLLMQCARPEPDLAALRRAAAGVADWTTVLGQAARHGLRPLLHWRLDGCCADLVPPIVAVRLEALFRANVARNLAMSVELRAILGWLDAGGVPAIAFKGPTLAALAYEDLGLREFSDLDVVIPPRDRVRALSILSRNGCRAEGAPGAVGLPGSSEIGLTTSSGYHLDLHWLVSPTYFLPFDVRNAFERAQRVPVAGALVPTFGPDDLFTCLALHGAHHCWASLTWICDVASLVRVAPPDWDRLLANRRTRRVFYVAVLLATDLLSAPVPADVIDAARGDRVAVALAAQVRRGILEGLDSAAGTSSEAAMHLRMLTAAHDKARYIWRRALQPNQTDNDFLPLSPSLRPLLWLVRPFRILAKLASGS